MFRRWKTVDTTPAQEELETANLQLASAGNQKVAAESLTRELRLSRQHNHYGERMGKAFAAQRRRGAV